MLTRPSPAQKAINFQIPESGQIHLTDGISIPKINSGYTVWLPENKPALGLIVFLHSWMDTVNADSIVHFALAKRLGVMYVTTNNRLEFFFDEGKIIEVEKYIEGVLADHNIPTDHLFYCGMSLAGTRALKLAMHSSQRSGDQTPRPRAIAICDAPLDMVRFHREMVKARDLNFTPVTANEGKWVSGYLEKNLGGTPTEQFDAYAAYSPYCYEADGGANLNLFPGIAIRAYTEPDVGWWMKTRRKDYYAMNAIDLAAFVNALNVKGNTNAHLITTADKGFQPDGTRHPHSWSIVDEEELVDWFWELIRK